MPVNSRHFLYADTHSGSTYQGLLPKKTCVGSLFNESQCHNSLNQIIHFFGNPLQLGLGHTQPLPARPGRDREWLHHAAGSLRVSTRGHLIGYRRFREHWFHSGPLLLVVQTARPISKRIPSDPTGYTLCLEYHPQPTILPEDWIPEL